MSYAEQVTMTDYEEVEELRRTRFEHSMLTYVMDRVPPDLGVPATATLDVAPSKRSRNIDPTSVALMAIRCPSLVELRGRTWGNDQQKPPASRATHRQCEKLASVLLSYPGSNASQILPNGCHAYRVLCVI